MPKTEPLVGASDPDPPWWSDEDDDEKTDRNGADNTTTNGKNGNDEEFESFSCTDDDEDEEGDQTSLDSTSTSRSQEETKSRFSKTKSLRDKFRDSKTWSLRRSAEKELSPTANNSGDKNGGANSNNTSTTSESGSSSTSTYGQLSRLFSLRRSIGPGVGPFDHSKNAMPCVAEEEEQMAGGPVPTRRQQPPTLPPAPPGLNPAQLKRRHIISSLVHSENNYVASLQRLVNDYKRPLEESNPPILSSNKVSTLFHRIPEILQCHTLFRIALSEAIRNWDSEEKIGDVFVASFSKAVVLEIYSDFINNFTAAMECAKQESKRKSALADFLKVKQITAHDRVSFFGLMVKPVQRFPQFILLLQDLLKETPPGHADRMALQLALTTLESLAEMLNERKREAEQFAAFRDKLRSISGKLSSPRNVIMAGNGTCQNDSPNGSHSSGGQNGSYGRFLLREDDMTHLEFNASGLIARSKPRRLLLLNDLLVCVAVNGRSSEVEYPNGSGSNSTSTSANERLTLKWAVPVSDVELIDGTAGGTLARVLAYGTGTCGSGSGTGSKRASLTRSVTPNHLGLSSLTLSGSSKDDKDKDSGGQAENLAQDMNDLMHDYDVVSRIAGLIGTLKGQHEGLDTGLTGRILSEIQRSIRQKDEEMSWVDACCLQFSIKTSKGSRGERCESYTFQTRDPNVKKEWIVELRLAQLALDPNNSPGWDVLEQERSVSTKMPLYVKSFLVCQNKMRQTEVTCGASYTLLIQTATRSQRPQTYVWTHATDGINSQLRIFGVTNQTGLKELGTVFPTNDMGTVKTIQYVPGVNNNANLLEDDDLVVPLRGDLVWIGTESRKILVYSAIDPDRGTLLATASLPSEILSMQFHAEAVWVGLNGGTLAVFRRSVFSLAWDLSCPQLIELGTTDPVLSLLPMNQPGIYAACGKRVWVVDANTNETLRSFVVQPRSGDDQSAQGDMHVHQMAQSGVGLWLALKHSSTICLYHTETFRHLQDINIASNVSRVLAARDVSRPQRSIHVTALMASRGLLWVGTNVGIALTVPLPRLEGVPIISGRANISYHAHFGPVTFFLNLQHKVLSTEVQQQPPAANSHVDSMIREESEKDLASVELEEDDEEEDEDTDVEESEKAALKKKFSDSNIIEQTKTSKGGPSGGGGGGSTKLRYRNSSPILTRRRVNNVNHNNASSQMNRRSSKTLPRGFSLANNNTDSLDCDVFGLYGELLNVRDYDCDSGERISNCCEDLRKSDPELSTIPYRVSTLDRRVRMKTSRPRSLDMSSWSVESRGSSSQTTSSSEAGSERPSPSVSRNASFQSNGGVVAAAATPTSSSSSGPASITSTMTTTTQVVKVKDHPTKLDTPKTIITLMGGRGYINWRRASVEKQRTSALAQINNCDAFMVIWEMKL